MAVKPLTLVPIIFLATSWISYAQSIIPTDSNGLYYQLGGGQVTPLPYTSDGLDINMNYQGDSNLGLNCGAFNPETSMMNSLNGLKNSYGGMAAEVEKNMTGMIIGELGYRFAKAWPNAYKFMRDGFAYSQNGVSLATKSCQTMLGEVDQGQNPGNNWLQAAVGDNWKYHMSIADSQAAQSGLFGTSASDIVEAHASIAKTGGKQGVQWVQGAPFRGAKYAGGQGQPPIYLTSDTVIAGYNVLIGGGRTYNDVSAPIKTKMNARLVSAFPTPKAAAKWVAMVVGEQEITTYSGGPKKSSPGKGLLNKVYDNTETIKTKLTHLVQNPNDVTIARLKAISPPGVLINDHVIHLIHHEPSSIMQAIYIHKIAQEVAVAKVIDKAKLGLQLLEVGSQVPSIFSNQAAQKSLRVYEGRMQQNIQRLRADPNDNHEFLGNTIAQLIKASLQREMANNSIRPSGNTPEMLQNGALKQESH